MKIIIAKTLVAVMLFLGFAPFAKADGLTLSQTNVYLDVGQSTTITVYSPNNQSVNIVSISNTYVAYANISNNILTIYGLAAGTTQIELRTHDNYSATVFVTVGANNPQQSLSFSPSTVTLNTGQNASVAIYQNGFALNSSYYVSANTNPNSVSTSITGNTLNLTALHEGFATITISTMDNKATGSISVTVNPLLIGGITLSQTYLSLMVGQSSTVNVSYGGQYANNFYISNNSNSNVATATLSGSTLTVYGQNPGSTTISIAAIYGSFGTANLYVTVSGQSYSNLYFLNQNPPAGYLGRYYSYNLSAAGGTPPYYFYLNSGNLPPGLYLATNGTISGSPTTVGNYNFNVRVQDYFNRSVISTNMNVLITSGSIYGASIYGNGTLLNENGTVFIVYKNTKTGFANLGAFSGLGYKWSNVISGSDQNLMNSGYVVTMANAAHPWGSWIKSGTTVYFVHDQGLIPIANYDVFVNNGGLDRLIVPANSYDFYKPILDIMTMSDYRLK